MRLITFLYAALFMAILSAGCSHPKKGMVSTAAFYNMGIKYLRSDANGKDYFQVYAKGSDENECKENAKIEVMKTLTYEGLRQGIQLAPILNVPAMVSDFKLNEQVFFRKYLNNKNVIETEDFIDKDRKLLQSEQKNAVSSMQVVVGIHKQKFTTEVLNSLNTK